MVLELGAQTGCFFPLNKGYVKFETTASGLYGVYKKSIRRPKFVTSEAVTLPSLELNTADDATKINYGVVNYKEDVP